MSARHLAILISLLFVLAPLSHTSAEEVETPDISCTSNVVNAGQEIECSLDLSDVQGVSSIRFSYFLEQDNSASDASVLV
tara:strand:- start:34 stop:273 length:240 start_codon:yes stop_codon:yes gene_type:complete